MQSNNERVNGLLDRILTFGEQFLSSDGGNNWSETIFFSTKATFSLPQWISFYVNILGDQLGDLIRSLYELEISSYNRQKIIAQIQSMITKLTDFDPVEVDPAVRNVRYEVSADFLKKFRSEIEILFDKDIVVNYPWAKGERDDVIVINSSANHKIKELLLDHYHSVIDFYENAEAKKIMDLQAEVSALGKEIDLLKIKLTSQQNNFEDLLLQETGDLRKENKQLKEDNSLLYVLNDDDSEEVHNDMFALILLNELGLLETPEMLRATKNAVANFLYNMLKISKKKKLTKQSITRYRHILLNPHTEPSVYEGWQRIYGKRVSDIIEEMLPGREVKLTKPIKFK
ncbi:hypothetical protein [Pedobacter sp. Leaf250]|uniref:hypothetical protein n=1 Tax=Pedobacter sp. Leaf250 TaxID=2876559 RepID=UPI001E5BC89D|nr:hypothetical protein [Pedobacter sp. Leaf250]